MIQMPADEQPSFPDHAAADVMAEQIRRHGYDLVRFQFVDYDLLRGARQDLAINPEQLDRFYYMLAALKRQGVRWMLDVVSGGGHDLHYSTYPRPDINDLRVRLQFDPAARTEWLRLLDAVYARPNPYTGKTILADPALAFVVGANENSIPFRGWPNPYPEGLAERFDHWVRRRYPAPAKLAQAIPDVSPSEAYGAQPVALPKNWSVTGPRMDQLMIFVSDLEIDTYRWYVESLTQRGFHGTVLAYHDRPVQLTNRTRAQLPVIDVHAYNGEVASFAQGASFMLAGSTQNYGLNSWLQSAAGRWLDRPMVASEYSEPYPNPLRFEGGLIFPAIAALQGYGTICRTTWRPVDAVMPMPGDPAHPLGLHPYGGGLDPSERAQDTLATLLFYRGDMASATHVVAVPFGNPEFVRTGSALLPPSLSRAALLTRFGLIPSEKASSLPAGAIVVPAGLPEAGEVLEARQRRLLTGDSGAAMSAIVQQLRARGALPPSNRTDPARGLFQSETGELTVDQPAGRIEVVTPMTEALSSASAASDVRLGAVHVRQLTDPALLSVSALDDRSVAKSHRLLVVLVGDVRNTGLQLSTTWGGKTQVNDWGKLPVQMQRVIADIDLAGRGTHEARLTVLSLAGAPLAIRPLKPGADGSLQIRLDMGAVARKPTTFFLIERD